MTSNSLDRAGGGMTIARRLALGRLVSLTGGSAAYIALVAAIYGATGSALWVSAAILASVVGSMVAAPFGGWPGVFAAAVSAAMAVTGGPAALVVLVGLSSVAQSPFEPASAAALPNLVAPEDVPRANAVVAATGSAGFLLGPLLGGLVLGVGASAATLFAVIRRRSFFRRCSCFRFADGSVAAQRTSIRDSSPAFASSCVNGPLAYVARSRSQRRSESERPSSPRGSRRTLRPRDLRRRTARRRR